MNKTELLHLLEETVPPLRGKLHIERVLYQKAANKAYMSFLSDELVTEHDYLLLERRLRELFPRLTVALRIASPSLGEKFLADLNRYKPVLTDFLRRQSPALAAWIADTFSITQETVIGLGGRADSAHLSGPDCDGLFSLAPPG